MSNGPRPITRAVNLLKALQERGHLEHDPESATDLSEAIKILSEINASSGVNEKVLPGDSPERETTVLNPDE